jgi:hypothetical protein
MSSERDLTGDAMPELKLPKKPVENWEQVRDEWVRAVEQLVSDVEGWCREQDWPTRRIDKRLEESRIGEYVVPALIIQADLVKLMLEPAARFASGSEGVLDLYRMPQYDDAASILRRDSGWVYVATITEDKLAREQRFNLPDSDVAGVTGRFTGEAFYELVKLLS